MNVGIYLDLRNPPAWSRPWSELYGFTLELCEEADRLGVHSVWLTEHHGFEDGYLTQPLAMLSAIAARTQRIRLGSAILLAPLRPAIQIAEEAALVDVISNGRLELGLGAGYRRPEFDLYGADFATRYGATVERVRALRSIWADDGHRPPPVQGRIPIWLGFNGPQGARRAGRLGEGLLAIDPALLDPYRRGLEEAGHDPGSARMAGLVHGFVTEDPERDWSAVKRHLAYQQDSYRRYMVEGTGGRTPRPVDPDVIRSRQIGEGGLIGWFLHATPEEVAGRLRAYIGTAPVETVFFWLSIAGMPDAVVMQHLQTLSTRLAPLLAADGTAGT
jgi:alkanesulfonate monooxygenase SsuD/methylene tetrahydromethanopterin reductase-like flavin-dependent oxidoreductase (luciferase family)